MHSTVFDLADHLAAKADPALVARDEEHFAAIGRALDRTVGELSARLDDLRGAPAGSGQAAMDRDLEVHRLSARLGTVRRYGLDLCLGRMVRIGDDAPVYVGRLGLTDPTGRRLLVDWRSPAAEPFFGATHADPMGLRSRRRYRWSSGRITDFWDEVFTPDGLEQHAALDDQSAFVASLGAGRSARMRDVLGTIQADQDAIIRAGSRGALVVDGGPGTGKTVVALHRTAYLLYSDPRLGHRRGGVLVVGPHAPYLDYVSDVLPALGEEGVLTCTLRDLVPEGARARPELDPRVARLKGSAALADAIEPAVRFYEQPPTTPTVVETPWADVRLEARDWAEAFASPAPATSHAEAREQVWQTLLDVLVDRVRDALATSAGGSEARSTGAWSTGAWSTGEWSTGEWDEPGDPDAWAPEEPLDAGDEAFDAYGVDTGAPDDVVRRALESNRDLVRTFGRAWPLVEATDLVGDLWSVPAYLRRCAPGLTDDEVAVLQREDPAAWTLADLPLLDVARRRLGDPGAARRRRRRQAEAAAEADRMSEVVADLVAHDDSEMHVMSMLRGQDLRAALAPAPGAGADGEPADPLAGPFAHVVVDEAQELTDAEWRMLLDRCPSRSLTVVGDRAQARHGFTGTWHERLGRVGIDGVEVASLTINYRTPTEVMEHAEPVIRAVLPDANVPTSVRSSGRPVRHGSTADLAAVLEAWAAEHDDGTACVIGEPEPRLPHEHPRVRALTPALAKGLEFDLVVLLDPGAWGTDAAGAVEVGAVEVGAVEVGAVEVGAIDRYVAMTRATQELVVLT